MHIAPPAPAQADLDDASRQFALLLNSVTDYAIYMLDADGRIRTWNQGGERIKGYVANEVIGSHYSRFYTDEDAAAGLPATNLKTAATEGRYSAEGWRVRKDGTRFRACVVIDPIREDGRLVGFAKVTRDITERFRAEERLREAQHALLQAQKMEAIRKLTLGLAHDFNNLLTIVVNSLDLIGSRVRDGKVSLMVDTALRASERGVLLTRQLLTFGRGQPLAPERLDVNALLQEADGLLRRSVSGSVALRVEPAPDLPPVDVDRAQLEAALLNLVGNSRDAMPDGGTITVRTCLRHASDPALHEAGESAWVCVEVADDGQGIPPEHQARVFEPFFTTKDVGKGSGLGLSQVFGFATQSGGHVRLQSAPGKGTTISMYLPAGEVA